MAMISEQHVFYEWKLLASLGVTSTNQCAPVMMSVNKIRFIHYINEHSTVGKYLTCFTEKKKTIEDERRCTTDIFTDPYLFSYLNTKHPTKPGSVRP